MTGRCLGPLRLQPIVQVGWSDADGAGTWANDSQGAAADRALDRAHGHHDVVRCFAAGEQPLEVVGRPRPRGEVSSSRSPLLARPGREQATTGFYEGRRRRRPRPGLTGPYADPTLCHGGDLSSGSGFETVLPRRSGNRGQPAPNPRTGLGRAAVSAQPVATLVQRLPMQVHRQENTLARRHRDEVSRVAVVLAEIVSLMSSYMEVQARAA